MATWALQSCHTLHSGATGNFPMTARTGMRPFCSWGSQCRCRERGLWSTALCQSNKASMHTDQPEQNAYMGTSWTWVSVQTTLSVVALSERSGSDQAER